MLSKTKKPYVIYIAEVIYSYVSIIKKKNSDIETKEAKKLLRKFCKTNLDGFKIPTKVNLVDRTNFSNRFKKIRRK